MKLLTSEKKIIYDGDDQGRFTQNFNVNIDNLIYKVYFDSFNNLSEISQHIGDVSLKLVYKLIRAKMINKDISFYYKGLCIEEKKLFKNIFIEGDKIFMKKYYCSIPALALSYTLSENNKIIFIFSAGELENGHFINVFEGAISLES